ncbi:hypothetical protein KM043_004309 [Ampulex compressa]|nr:hypothetical protein KM043_004309 [Ampulex compressa]
MKKRGKRRDRDGGVEGRDAAVKRERGTARRASRRRAGGRASAKVPCAMTTRNVEGTPRGVALTRTARHFPLEATCSPTRRLLSETGPCFGTQGSIPSKPKPPSRSSTIDAPAVKPNDNRARIKIL